VDAGVREVLVPKLVPEASGQICETARPAASAIARLTLSEFDRPLATSDTAVRDTPSSRAICA